MAIRSFQLASIEFYLADFHPNILSLRLMDTKLSKRWNFAKVLREHHAVLEEAFIVIHST